MRQSLFESSAVLPVRVIFKSLGGKPFEKGYRIDKILML